MPGTAALASGRDKETAIAACRARPTRAPGSRPAAAPGSRPGGGSDIRPMNSLGEPAAMAALASELAAGRWGPAAMAALASELAAGRWRIRPDRRSVMAGAGRSWCQAAGQWSPVGEELPRTTNAGLRRTRDAALPPGRPGCPDRPGCLARFQARAGHLAVTRSPDRVQHATRGRQRRDRTPGQADTALHPADKAADVAPVLARSAEAAGPG